MAIATRKRTSKIHKSPIEYTDLERHDGLATKSDIINLERDIGKMRGEIGEIKGEIAGLKGEIRILAVLNVGTFLAIIGSAVAMFLKP